MADNSNKGQKRAGRGRQDERRPGIVRAVSSGDTVTILDVETRPTNAPPKEVQLTLLALKAPLLGRKFLRDGKIVVEKDERWAWDSREYLRKRLIGRSVVYRVEHEAGNRSYGEVWHDEENVRFDIVREGWAEATVKLRKDGEVRDEDVGLEQLRDEAQKRGAGIWSTEKKGAVRLVKYREAVKYAASRCLTARGEKNDDLFDFFERMKNKPVAGIVEQVRTGSTLRVYLPGTADSIQLLLAGVRAPSVSGPDEAEPYGREARFVTEHLLLHRDVTVTIEGIDKYSNYFGSVVDAQGRSVAVNLLRMGLASVVDWSASPRTDLAAYRDAEHKAQDERLRIWREHKPLKGAGKKGEKPGSTETLTAKVVEVVNGSTIAVRVNKGERGEVDHKVSFSSVTVPRLLTRPDPVDPEKEAALSDDRRAKVEEERRQSQLAWEAKERLRKQLIGKSVKCVFDYVRPAFTPKNNEKPLPPKPFYSVYVKDRNVALDLVKEGLATVVPHGPNEPRSADFQELIIAEKSAQKAGKGLHAPASKATVARITDLTQQEPSRSAAFLQSLKRAGRVAAVVDYVFTGARYKLYVPSEEVLICLALQGISVEKLAKADVKGADVALTKLYPPAASVGNQALHFVRDRLFQRDVQVDIDSTDKGGNFIGALYVNGHSFAVELVREGLARVHHGSAQRLREYQELVAAEEAAKAALLGVWADYDAAAEAAKDAEATAAREAARSAQAEAAKITVTVTEIVDGSEFWYQQVGEQSSALDALMASMQQADLQPVTAVARGDLVLAKFSVDGQWYRAEVLRVREGEAEVRYVDYGNVESLPVAELRALDAAFSLKVLPRQAQRGRLAFVKTPKVDADFGVDAAALLKELVWDKKLVATVQFREGQGADAVSYLSLGDPEAKIPINAALVMSGLARVQKSRTKSAFYERLLDEQDKARKARLNIWQYGDVPDSDDEAVERARQR